MACPDLGTADDLSTDLLKVVGEAGDFDILASIAPDGVTMGNVTGDEGDEHAMPEGLQCFEINGVFKRGWRLSLS